MPMYGFLQEFIYFREVSPGGPKLPYSSQNPLQKTLKSSCCFEMDVRLSLYTAGVVGHKMAQLLPPFLYRYYTVCTFISQTNQPKFKWFTRFLLIAVMNSHPVIFSGGMHLCNCCQRVESYGYPGQILAVIVKMEQTEVDYQTGKEVSPPGG